MNASSKNGTIDTFYNLRKKKGSKLKECSIDMHSQQRLKPCMHTTASNTLSSPNPLSISLSVNTTVSHQEHTTSNKNHCEAEPE